MKTTLLASTLIASSLFLSSAAHAEFKLATVDLNRILNESTMAKEERKTLDAMSKQAKTKLEAKKTEIAGMEKQIRDKKLSDDSKEVKQINEEIKNFNILVKTSEDEVKTEFLKVNKVLTEKALKLVNEYAAKKDLDLVMDRSERTRGPVLFGDPGVDITNEILKQMDQR